MDPWIPVSLGATCQRCLLKALSFRGSFSTRSRLRGGGFYSCFFCQTYQNASGEISSLSHNGVIHIVQKV